MEGDFYYSVRLSCQRVLNNSEFDWDLFRTKDEICRLWYIIFKLVGILI